MAQPKTTATKTSKQNPKLKTLKTASGTYTQVNLLHPHTVLMACSSVNHYRPRGQARPTGNHVVSTVSFQAVVTVILGWGRKCGRGTPRYKAVCTLRRSSRQKLDSHHWRHVSCTIHVLNTDSPNDYRRRTQTVRTQSGCSERLGNCLAVQGW